MRYGVVHLGSRTHYQVSLALAEHQRLATLYTDFYTPDWVERISPVLPPRVRRFLDRRRVEGLPSTSVRCPASLRSVLSGTYFGLGREHEPYVAGLDWYLGQAVGQLSGHCDFGWVVYSLYWPGFLSRMGKLPEKHPPRIVFKEHPTPSQVLSCLHTHRARAGRDIQSDAEERMSARSIAAYETSLKKADGIIVPCEFVKRGVVELGIPENLVAVVPFGSNRKGLSTITQRAPTSPDRPIRLLWVGQPLFRKGFHDLLAAYAGLPPRAADLTIVLPSAKAVPTAGQLPGAARLLVRLTPSELAREFSTHDLLVMPSLVEGFGMVYLEALSFGTPIICTPNTGAPDIITDGREGFIVEPGDRPALIGCIMKVVDDPSRLYQMKVAAKRAGATWTWDRFRTTLVESIQKYE